MKNETDYKKALSICLKCSEIDIDVIYKIADIFEVNVYEYLDIYRTFKSVIQNIIYTSLETFLKENHINLEYSSFDYEYFYVEDLNIFQFKLIYDNPLIPQKIAKISNKKDIIKFLQILKHKIFNN